MNRLYSLLIVIGLIIFGVHFPISGNNGKERISELSFTDSEYLGSYLERVMPRHCILTRENDQDILYTTSNGTPAVFNAFNLTTGELLASFELKGNAAWSHQVDSEGTVYVTLDGNLYRYFPDKRNMEYLGSVPGSTATYGLCFDEYDNPYVGTFPQGKIFRYHKGNEEWQDLGVVVEGDQYVRSLVYHKGYFYASTYAESGSFVRINGADFTDKEVIELPIGEGVTLSVAYATVVRDYLVINARISNGSNPLLIYDTATGEFVTHDYKGVYKGVYCSPEMDGKFYFNNGAGVIYEYNLLNDKVTSTGITYPANYSVDFNGGGFIKDGTLVTVKPECPYPILVNFENNSITEMTEALLEGSSVSIQSLATGPGDSIAVGGYTGVSAAVYNTITREAVLFDSDQPEAMLSFDEKLYLGLYTGANIQVYDPKKLLNDGNPKIIKRIGEEQDRPFGLASGEDKLFVGTVPAGNKIGGAFSVFDKNTEQWDVYRNVVPEQSVVSLLYMNGFVYGGTSIFGGYGTSPTKEKPCIFVWDVENGEKVREFYPNIPDIDYQPLAYNKLLAGPDGLIWVGAKNLIFAMDPETGQVKKHLELSSSEWSVDTFVWRSTYMEFDRNGFLYLALNKTTDLSDNGIYIIDPDTLEYINISDKAEGYKYIRDMTIGTDGNIYYGVAGGLYTIGVTSQIAEIVPRRPSINAYSRSFFGFYDRKDGESVPAGVSFGAVLKGTSHYPILKMGILYSETESEREALIKTGIPYEATEALDEKSSVIRFGIRLFGKQICYNVPYYTIPYLIYEDNGTPITIYGDRVTTVISIQE